MSGIPDTDKPSVIVQVTIQPRPDGPPWVGVEFATGVNRYVVAFPPEQAERIADALPDGLRQAARECRVQATGIITASGIEGIDDGGK